LRRFMLDARTDILTVLGETVLVMVKVVLIYMLISLATDLRHDQALETAILIGAVDFLNGQRTHFLTVTDLKERITTTERGKRTVESIHKHTTKSR
jgi:hypothetical protein